MIFNWLFGSITDTTENNHFHVAKLPSLRDPIFISLEVVDVGVLKRGVWVTNQIREDIINCLHRVWGVGQLRAFYATILS